MISPVTVSTLSDTILSEIMKSDCSLNTCFLPLPNFAPCGSKESSGRASDLRPSRLSMAHLYTVALIRIKGANTNVLVSPTQKSATLESHGVSVPKQDYPAPSPMATGGQINITYSHCFQPGREINTRQVARKPSGCSINAECRT